MPANIRLGWKATEVANTLAYYETSTITAVKGLIVQAPDENQIFNFKIILFWLLHAEPFILLIVP